MAKAKPDPAAQALARVKRAAGPVEAARQALDAAEPRFHDAIRAAVAELREAGVRDANAQVARAAGLSRQAVRQLVERGGKRNAGRPPERPA